MNSEEDFLFSEKQKGDGCFLWALIQNFFSEICQKISNLLFGTMLRADSIDNNIIIFDDEDILGLSNIPKNSNKFLNYFDHNELINKIMKYKVKNGSNAGYSIEQILQSKNLNDLIFDFDTSDYYVHKMYVFNEKKDSHNLICQLFLRVNSKFNVSNAKKISTPDYMKEAFEEGTRFMKKKLGGHDLDLTVIDWLRLQDYRIQPKKGCMVLPGQIHPGLGIGHEIEEMLMDFIQQRGRDGSLNTPEHWHNAYMYYNSSHFHFLNPAFEGFFRSINESIRKDIESHRLTAVAWAIAQGKLYHKQTGEKIKWATLEQVCPISRKMHNYFGQEYIDIVMRNYHPEDYFIDWDDEQTKTKTIIGNEENNNRLHKES
ncbi:hypothetical protein KM1_196850 [Entamoeba histolytica HM-3:IMSS]|uniref:Uncharacterized protein n=6 Tax=Entamoeba histolytica TaxID=5759 RepID=C4M2P9_ENTH1|nr:hypothetical protein, conserved [Entamoeba histolytica HM-1:IMSS]EAL48050.1 hypothetical protein, conserved [Entamoeba histolytica HM-1:IMSS]EMS14608.1 hypothetical protein KM1_196850 [Entamoeba histolytica HM-3:IMSS]ENY61375.1 hypothetical protein EHI7A_114580 [Entamoeba histolytica HM-1:IMSS-A]GAT95558.1 hypothetical protein conserved [Entamoeba histolytica]|eukprot:XP_653438.1 hypothetical protein, conserved [Entamoeba histolytica HM-1:IMSS]